MRLSHGRLGGVRVAESHHLSKSPHGADNHLHRNENRKWRLVGVAAIAYQAAQAYNRLRHAVARPRSMAR